MFSGRELADSRDITPEIKPILEDIKRLKRLERYDEAIDKCKKILETIPENSDLHVELGDLYFEKHLNKYHASYTIDDAITQYQYALEMKTNSPKIHFKLGKTLSLKGEFDKALNHFKTATKYDPNFSKAYFMKGIVQSKRDNLDEAIYLFGKAIALAPFESSKAHFNLYLALRNKARIIKHGSKFKIIFKAYKHLCFFLFSLLTDNDAVRDLSKSAKEFFKLLPVVFLGYFYERTGSLEKAIDVYSEALEKAMGFAPLYISLGDTYRKLNRIEDAINEYRMAIWLNPASIQAYKNLCATFEEMGDYENAVKTYKKLLGFRPYDAILYSNLANILYMKGDVSDAISAYQTAIVLNPNKTWTSVVAQTLGYVFQESKGDYDAAIAAYQSATLLNPKDVDIYVSLGSAFFDKGDLNNALAAYRSALEIDPGNAKVHCNMGYLLWGKNSIQEAINSYETAIELDPYYDIAYNNLGVIYLDDLGKIDKALDLFQKAVEINPNYALAYYNQARSMSIKGDKIEAARLFQIAIDLNSFTNELDANEIKDRIARLFDSE